MRTSNNTILIDGDFPAGHTIEVAVQAVMEDGRLEALSRAPREVIRIQGRLIPSNDISAGTATADGLSIALTWTNPDDVEFSAVHVYRSETDSYLIDLPELIVDDRDISHLFASRTQNQIGSRSLPTGIDTHRRTPQSARRTTPLLQSTAITPPKPEIIGPPWIYELTGDAVVEAETRRTQNGVSYLENITVLLYQGADGVTTDGSIHFTRDGSPSTPTEIEIELEGRTERQDSGFDYVDILADDQTVAHYESIGVSEPDNYDSRSETVNTTALASFWVEGSTGDSNYNVGVFWRATITFNLTP